uniref:C-type lectin domain-containing protein n=1 Tax=Gouania willdenowi TaxID=441366 RepID=A0A8C5ERC2_GOUWI
VIISRRKYQYIFILFCIYIFKFISTPMNWTSAMEYCRKHHVDLAVVRNLPENNQLKEMVKDEYNWIGLYRDPWKWSDGKLLSYTKWNIGEPNQGVNGPCVFLHKGHWGDYECESAIYFVCNKECSESESHSKDFH